MTEWWKISAVEHAKAIKTKKITSIELTEYYIKRIEKYNKQINAVIYTMFDRARKRAKEMDALLANGTLLGPLHGVPVTIKEGFWMTDTPATCAIDDMPFFNDFISTSNAPTVQAYLNAGAVVLGKTNLPIHAADFQSYNPRYGITNNPYDLTRVPGGSSGGSAASICAGFSALELGSDIGGSIRNPAHFCGVVGHKPTQGITSLVGHSPARNHPLLEPIGRNQARQDPVHTQKLAVSGPLARTCDDLELAMNILAEPDLHQKAGGFSFQLPKPEKTSPKGLKIAAWLDDPFNPVSTECVALMKTACEKLEAAGAVIYYNARPTLTLQEGFSCWQIISNADMNPEFLKDSFNTWQRAQIRRNYQKTKWSNFFKDYDVLFCPIMPTGAFKHKNDHDYRSEKGMNRTWKVNGKERNYWRTGTIWAGLIIVSDLPSTVVPVGFDKNNMPFGMQIVSDRYKDLQTIEVGKMLENLGFKYNPPSGYEDDTSMAKL